MIHTIIANNGLVFSAEQQGRQLNFEEWSSTDDCIYYFPLSNLVDNGNATIDGQKCILPFESIYLLDDEERQLLGIPANYKKSIRLRAEGMLNSSDYQYKLELLTHVPDGQLIKYSREGNIVITDSGRYLLNEEQYQLFDAVDSFNHLPEEEKTTDNNLRTFGLIKSLAKASKCELDSYLENENVFVPEKIDISLGREGEDYTVKPSIGIEQNENFQNVFQRQRKVLPVYPVQNEKGERTRVVFSPRQREALVPLKQQDGRFKNREDIQKIVENPTEYFDPELFDLKEFYSDRVIEIGIYRPKFSAFVSPYKSQWIAGAEVETPNNGTTRITFENVEQLQSFEKAIEEAEQKGEPNVAYQETYVAVEDAKFLANVSRKQLEAPHKPVNLDDPGLKEQQPKETKKVLIIEENKEELTFDKYSEGAVSSDGTYTLHVNPGLEEKYSLKAHQREGVAWLQHLYEKKANGCLMADDMGLGKTLQILYFIDWHSRTHSDHKPYLIVAPVSLLENWENEYKRFFKEPKLSVRRLGSGEVPRTFDPGVVDYMQHMDIILTSYETMRNSQMNFCAVEFDVIALDEAQRIKTPGTMVTTAAKALKGTFRIAMTGTPVENSLMDLWCIMDFCMPGLLGNAKSFSSQYEAPMKNAETDMSALGNAVHERLGVYFMRRLKKDAAKDLPEKYVSKHSYPMPKEQESSYCEAIRRHEEKIQPNMLQTLHEMKAISEHPYLFDNTLSQRDTKELIDTAARLQATIKLLDDIKLKDEKVIVFAERRESQKMLQKVFFERYGLKVKIINGETPASKKKISWMFNETRQESIDTFQAQEGFNIIIMSPIAAGMGLNVTGANHVIHFARHWNPAKESQATDRAYRIGQPKDVFVYYPMAISSHYRSFDETLDDLLNRKSDLATSTLFPTENIVVANEELAKVFFENVSK